jgi:hypothetical protein
MYKIITIGELPEHCTACRWWDMHEIFLCEYCIVIGETMSSIEANTKRLEHCPLVSSDDLTVSSDGRHWLVEMPDQIGRVVNGS